MGAIAAGDQRVPRVIVIVGASSGMGAALARRCARAGDPVVLVARRKDVLETLAEGLVTEPAVAEVLTVPRVLVVDVDVRDGEAGEEIAKRTLAAFQTVYAVVYLAGWNTPSRAIAELSSDSWDRIVDTNLGGAFRVTKAFVPVMRSRGGGLLIYVSSTAAKRADKSGTAYQASKAGLAALANTTMEECRGDNVRTSVVYPGMTNTPFLSHRPVPTDDATRQRALQPDDVAAACKFIIDMPERVHVSELVLGPSML